MLFWCNVLDCLKFWKLLRADLPSTRCRDIGPAAEVAEHWEEGYGWVDIGVFGFPFADPGAAGCHSVF